MYVILNYISSDALIDHATTQPEYLSAAIGRW